MLPQLNMLTLMCTPGLDTSLTCVCYLVMDADRYRRHVFLGNEPLTDTKLCMIVSTRPGSVRAQPGEAALPRTGVDGTPSQKATAPCCPGSRQPANPIHRSLQHDATHPSGSQ